MESLKPMLDFVNQGWVGVAIGALLSVYFYFKGVREARPCYAVRSAEVVNVHANDEVRANLSVTFTGEPVPRLSVA